jgi:hypothetical protein
MPTSLPKIYSYNPKATKIILCILFFGACAAVLAWKATTNDRGLVLNGIFTFSESGASIFYWVLSALSAGFVSICILLTIQRVMGPVSIEITETALRIPHGFFMNKITEVILSEVIDLSEVEVQGERFLQLHTPNKIYRVNRSLMPSREDYEEVKALITALLGTLSTKNCEPTGGADG